MPMLFFVQVQASRLAVGLLFALAGCSRGSPELLRLEWTPGTNPRCPLVLEGSVTTNRTARVRVHLDDGERPRTIERWQRAATEHELLVLGLRPATHYALVVELVDPDDPTLRSFSAPWTWTTPGLPAWFPPVHVTVSRPARMEPGFTLVPCVRWPDQGDVDRQRGALLALDEHGDIVWFYDAPHAISEAKRLSNGNLVYYHGTLGDVVELDPRGDVLRRWSTTRIPGKVLPEGAIPIDAGTLHHELRELPSGNFLTLSTELRSFASYPASETDPNVPPMPASVVGDVILEFRPDGTVVRRWPVLDLLDPYRIGYESLDSGFWQNVHAGTPEAPLRDWAHVNSVFHDERDDSFIVSSYHQDAVFKLDPTTGALRWILGFPTGWGERWQPLLLDPIGDGLYPFHQHAATVTPHGTLLLFDNGKYRALPPDPKVPAEQSFSRAVEFAIDEERGEFREVWSWGGRPDEHFFTPFLGETDWLPRTGHVLVTDGGRVRLPDGRPGFHPAQGRKWARIVEVTHDRPAEVVFEIVIDDPRCGWTVYRSERLASLYADAP